MNMLASVPVIVEKVSDEDSARREVVSLWLSFQESARAEEDASQEMRRRLFALGKRLIAERERYPKSRPPPGKVPWSAFLDGCGIEHQRASEAMRYAGFAEKILPPGGKIDSETELPSLYEAGIKEHPKKATEPKEDKEPEPFHILIALGDLKDCVRDEVESWPAASRLHAATALRDLAKEIEKEAGTCK